MAIAPIYAGQSIITSVFTGQTGDTLTFPVAVKGNGGTAVPTYAAIGDGKTYRITIPTAAGEEGVWTLTTESALAPGPYGPEDFLVQAADVGAALANIGAGRVTVVSPVAQDGTILRLVRGDDYLNADGRALEWTTTDAATWPTLTGASVALHIEGAAAAMAGSVITPTGSTKKVRVELADTQSAGLTEPSPLFQVVATLANTDVVTLVAGRARISDRITP